MKPYHKIPTVYKRDPDNKFKTLLEGVYATPELEYLAELDWVWTEKVDGTNVRVRCDARKLEEYEDDWPAGPLYPVTFAGKTNKAQLPTELITALEKLFHTDEQRARLAELLPTGACLYGEGYGPKIQNGGKYRDSVGFVLFDVRVGNWWLRREAVDEIGAKLGLDVVPVVGHGTLGEAIEYVRSGFDSAWGDFSAEGLVCRPWIGLQTRGGERIIAKIKEKDFGLIAIHGDRLANCLECLDTFIAHFKKELAP